MEVVSVVTALLELVLKLVSASEAKDLLDELAVQRANAIADTAEELKFK
jgi:hypothetical protein